MNLVSILWDVTLADQVLLAFQKVAKRGFNSCYFGEDKFEEKDVIDGLMSYGPSNFEDSILCIWQNATAQ